MGDVVLDYNPLSLAIKAAKSTHNVNASNTSATNANATATATAETNDNNDNNASDGSDESGRGTWKVVGGEDKVGTSCQSFQSFQSFQRIDSLCLCLDDCRLLYTVVVIFHI